MTLQEKSELVRLLNLYQADLLNLNRKNIENGKTEYFVHGVKAQYEHARIISTNSLGNVNYSGEISYTDLVIRICPNAQAKMEADFLHEMVHGMLDHLGYTEHDEKKVDELANVLHMVILDNPTVFTPVKEGQHENVCNTESEDR